jgi:hypothetical protein
MKQFVYIVPELTSIRKIRINEGAVIDSFSFDDSSVIKIWGSMYRNLLV